MLGLVFAARQRVSQCMRRQGALGGLASSMRRVGLRCEGLLLHHCCSGSGKPGAGPPASGLLKAMRHAALALQAIDNIMQQEGWTTNLQDTWRYVVIAGGCWGACAAPLGGKECIPLAVGQEGVAVSSVSDCLPACPGPLMLAWPLAAPLAASRLRSHVGTLPCLPSAVLFGLLILVSGAVAVACYRMRRGVLATSLVALLWLLNAVVMFLGLGEREAPNQCDKSRASLAVIMTGAAM